MMNVPESTVFDYQRMTCLLGKDPLLLCIACLSNLLGIWLRGYLTANSESTWLFWSIPENIIKQVWYVYVYKQISISLHLKSQYLYLHMRVSSNSGTRKSFMFIGIFSINQPCRGTPLPGTPICTYTFLARNSTAKPTLHPPTFRAQRWAPNRRCWPRVQFASKVSVASWTGSGIKNSC